MEGGQSHTCGDVPYFAGAVPWIFDAMTLTSVETRDLGVGKPQWHAMLDYVLLLHERSTHAPRPPFVYPWEEIGPGYVSSPAFGHWDIVHQILDTLPGKPEHARQQILNNLV